MLEKVGLLWTAWQFLSSPEGAAFFAGLFAASEAFSMIPWIKSNGVFQAIYEVLKKLAGK